MTDRTTSLMLMAQAQPGTTPVTPSEVPSAPATSITDQSNPAQATDTPVIEAPVPEAPPVPSSLFENMFDFITLGGPVVMLLLLLSLFALTIILVKMWQFLGGSGASRQKISGILSLWLAQDYEGAATAMNTEKGPVARVLAFAMAGNLARRDEAHLREETEHLAQCELTSLRSYLRALEAVVQVSPLLGLFGTVLGMIEAFRALEAAGSQVNPADLAGGIWVALMTTAVGLAVAMPVSLVLHWFESRIDGLRQSMELFTTEVLTNPPAQGAKAVRNGNQPIRLAVAAGE